MDALPVKSVPGIAAPIIEKPAKKGPFQRIKTSPECNRRGLNGDF